MVSCLIFKVVLVDVFEVMFCVLKFNDMVLVLL